MILWLRLVRYWRQLSIMNTPWKKYLFIVIAFALGFAAALVIGRKTSQSGKEDASLVAPTQPGLIDPAGLVAFLAAAKKGDYAVMEKSGSALFAKGAQIPNAPEQFKEYEANSFPPYTVYAFYSQGSSERVRRVLLTLDENNRVESFLAEEMTVVP